VAAVVRLLLKLEFSSALPPSCRQHRCSARRCTACTAAIGAAAAAALTHTPLSALRDGSCDKQSVEYVNSRNRAATYNKYKEFNH